MWGDTMEHRSNDTLATSALCVVLGLVAAVPVALPMLGQLAFGAACLTFFLVAAWLMVREWRRPVEPRRAARDWDRWVDGDWREW